MKPGRLTKESKCCFCKATMPVGAPFVWQRRMYYRPSKKYGMRQVEGFAPSHVSHAECEAIKSATEAKR